MSTEIKKKKKNNVSNDPIADCLTRVRNALLVNKTVVAIPFSKLKLSLVQLLQREGYIVGYKVTNEDSVVEKSIEVELKYTAEGKSVITGLKRVSRPGLRKYTKAKYAPRVLNGLGISVISTSEGLRTDRETRAKKTGGEVLCQVW